MGESRVSIMQVARATGLSGNILTKLYFSRARRIELQDRPSFGNYFQCSLGDLLEATYAIVGTRGERNVHQACAPCGNTAISERPTANAGNSKRTRPLRVWY